MNKRERGEKTERENDGRENSENAAAVTAKIDHVAADGKL